MAAYTYVALTSSGKTQKGVIEGDSPRQVGETLRQQQLTPLEIHIVKGKKFEKKFFLKLGQRIAITDLALMTRQLATLLAAGLPVEETLLGVSEQVEKPALKQILLGVRSKILEGHTLAHGLSQFPQAFPELYCATVGAGEQTGKLDVILNRLADYTEQQQKMRQKIKQALIYPSVMAFVAIAIVAFLLVFVVPKIVGVFNTTGQTLPGVTLFLIGLSNYARQYGLYLLLLCIAGIVLFRYLLRRENIRLAWHRFLLRLPLIGYTIKTINTARYARTFGILSIAGVPVLDAMHVSSTLITNLPMRQSISKASEKVREGSNINTALKQTGYFSPMTLHLIASGERSGRLEELLERAADNQDNEVTRMIETGLTLFEPAIILVMGSIVLFIVLAILLPIFSLNQFAS